MRQRENRSVNFRWRFATNCPRWRSMRLLKTGHKFSSMLLVPNSKREAGPESVSLGGLHRQPPAQLPWRLLFHGDLLLGWQHLPQVAGLAASLWQAVQQVRVQPWTLPGRNFWGAQARPQIFRSQRQSRQGCLPAGSGPGMELCPANCYLFSIYVSHFGAEGMVPILWIKIIMNVNQALNMDQSLCYVLYVHYLF